LKCVPADVFVENFAAAKQANVLICLMEISHRCAPSWGYNVLKSGGTNGYPCFEPAFKSLSVFFAERLSTLHV
jgi:hypothetical protein